jgi:hypothetical protein
MKHAKRVQAAFLARARYQLASTALDDRHAMRGSRTLTFSAIMIHNMVGSR